MARTLRIVFGSLIAVLVLGGPLVYWTYWQSHLRNFRVVSEGVLYRSGQMSVSGLKRVVHDHQIKTVITLRDAAAPGQKPPDFEEEQYCQEQEISYYRIPPRNWEAPDGSVPADKGVELFRQIMDNPANYPVLVHCFAGIHRTGTYCAIYRMEYERWTNAAALQELRTCGYDNLDNEWDVLGFLERYRPRWRASGERNTTEEATQDPGQVP